MKAVIVIKKVGSYSKKRSISSRGWKPQLDEDGNATKFQSVVNNYLDEDAVVDASNL